MSANVISSNSIEVSRNASKNRQERLKSHKNKGFSSFGNKGFVKISYRQSESKFHQSYAKLKQKQSCQNSVNPSLMTFLTPFIEDVLSCLAMQTAHILDQDLLCCQRLAFLAFRYQAFKVQAQSESPPVQLQLIGPGSSALQHQAFQPQTTSPFLVK